ncbi:MAG: beta-N-acetylhexosaminidase [Candidatus Saccharibacteria bacterium]
MKRTLISLMVLVIAFVFFSCRPAKTFTASELALIPQPQEMMLGKSSFQFKKSTKLVVENIDQKVIAMQFSQMFQKASGWKMETIVGGDEGSNQVYFRTEPMMGPEAYSLDVTTQRIEIKAAKPAGFFYAMQTLRQLLPVQIESSQKQDTIDWLVPVIAISDTPTYKWRGFMLDVARHFFPKEDVMKIIDDLALHKINTFHFHLTDDQGWRIEIKKYPKLTETGAWRVDHEDIHWNNRPKQQEGEKATYGGFYTQDDIREIIKYAQSRFITVVPEIEMPAHVTAALAAYPYLSCTGGPFTVLPGGVWPITDIYCAGKDTTFQFVEDVLSEVMQLFPSKYIHIGGDEATKTEWEKCPFCQARIKKEGLKNVGELQSYFVKRVEKFVNSKGKTLLGWDEIIEGGLPEEATVMSWRGFEGGIEAANQGHDVVMTPTSFCYIDYYQGKPDMEPPGIGGYLPLSKVYSFNPMPEQLSAQAAKHILGGQGNLWTEYVPNLKHAEYMAFPRMAAMAEVLWSKKEVRNWEDFSRRIKLFMKRYDQAGINYSKSAYNVSATTLTIPDENKLEVTLGSELDRAEIHYTLDGSEPTTSSAIYHQPVIIDHSLTLRATTIVDNIPTKKVLTRTYDFNKATFKPVKYITPFNPNYPGTSDFTLVNAINGSTDHTDGEWQGWLGKNAEVVVDLKQAQEIRSISVGSLVNVGAMIHTPQKIEYFVSADGFQFQKVAEIDNEPDSPSAEVVQKDYAASFVPQSASFVKIIATNTGPGNWVFLDEIKVE